MFYISFSFLYIQLPTYTCICAGRIVIGLYGQVVPKTVGMSLRLCVYSFMFSILVTSITNKKKKKIVT